MGDDLLTRLGTVVRTLREQQDLSVLDLARRSGLSTRFVSEVQAGRANISIVRLSRLARALGTAASRLVAGAEGGGTVRPTIVALLGVRGAGKTTVGKKVAARLGVEFVELDRLVESEAGLPLAEIFATHGETYFRRLEVAALRRFLARGIDAVLTTGGGVVENDEAWRLLDEHTVTVWLRAGMQAHWDRVVQQGDPRPMAGHPAARAELRKLLAARAPLYRRASIRIDTTRLGLPQSVSEVVRRVAGRFPPDRIRAGDHRPDARSTSGSRRG